MSSKHEFSSSSTVVTASQSNSIGRCLERSQAFLLKYFSKATLPHDWSATRVLSDSRLMTHLRMPAKHGPSNTFTVPSHETNNLESSRRHAYVCTTRLVFHTTSYYTQRGLSWVQSQFDDVLHTSSHIPFFCTAPNLNRTERSPNHSSPLYALCTNLPG